MPASLSLPKYQSLLDQIEGLNFQDFRKFLVDLERLRSKKKPPTRQEELLQLIQSGGPGKVLHRKMVELSQTMDLGKLSDDGYKELMALVDMFHAWTVKRVELMIELADLENITLEQLVDRYDLKQIEAE